jgi:hypothetical protein
MAGVVCSAGGAARTARSAVNEPAAPDGEEMPRDAEEERSSPRRRPTPPSPTGIRVYATPEPLLLSRLRKALRTGYEGHGTTFFYDFYLSC